MRQRPFLLHMLFAVVMAAVAWHLWPAGSASWRRLVGVALGFGLGFQAATAIGAMSRGRVAAITAWLECLAFPLAMGAFYYLPSARGWILLLASWSWRFWVLNLWHRK